jgi:hypothetical protein
LVDTLRENAAPKQELVTANQRGILELSERPGLECKPADFG